MSQIQCTRTEFDVSNARGLQGQVHWTIIKVRASALICHISRIKVNAFINLINTRQKKKKKKKKVKMIYKITSNYH